MRTNGWRAVGPTGLPEIDSIHRLELVAVVDDARFAFLTELAEAGLNLHPDLDVLVLDVNDLRREPNPFLHFDDRHHVRFLHLELRRGVMDDRVGHDLPLPPQPEAIHLAHGLPATDRADSPGRKVNLPAVPAFRAEGVVAARVLPPEPGNRQVSPPSRRGGPPQWRPSPRACA